jgi:hypothetical protein
VPAASGEDIRNQGIRSFPANEAVKREIKKGGSF